MNLIFAVFLSGLVMTFCAQQFTADFTVTHSKYNRGYFEGTLFYDWEQSSFILQFPKANLYSELYRFNSMKGMDPLLMNGQFYSQYLYRKSASCSCETNSLNYAMPPFFQAKVSYSRALLDPWIPGTLTKTLPAGTCNHFLPNPAIKNTAGSVSLVTDYWETSGGVPCAFTLVDGRTFTLLTNKVGAISATTFEAPKNCKCSKPLDLVLSLDRSGSISPTEWITQHDFIENISKAFEFGPLATNMAILNWNKAQWTSLQLLDGTSLTAVTTAINAMKCCGSGGSCCCCGTPIGGGLYTAGQEMLTSNRLATKIIIILTDGCQNHAYDPSTNPATVTACGCSSEVSCASNAVCNNDIQDHYNTVTRSIPGVKIIVLGVGASSGASQEICPSQLIKVAGGQTNMVFNPQSWEELSGFVESIAATACTITESLCSNDCCGICSCGVCIKPTSCTDKDKCTLSKIDDITKCCADVPVTCTPEPCKVATCDPATGCSSSPVTCRPNTNCYTYACDPLKDTCVTTKICPDPECLEDATCKDDKLCTIDQCINQTCVFTPKNCGVSDKCTKRSCDPKSGRCLTEDTICNDNNLCTIDTCDPVKGCVFTNKTCNPPSDKCEIPLCLPSRGCYTTRRLCDEYKSDNCTSWSCRSGGCKNQTYFCAPPPPYTDDINVAAVVGTALGVGALVGIIVAGVVAAVGFVGGGAYAYAQTGAGGGAADVVVNPLYSGKGNQGENPLFKGGA